MKTYNANHLKSGMKIVLSNEPLEIIENEIVKPGKGLGFSRIKLKNLQTNKIIEKTFKSNEIIQSADIKEVTVQLLYSDNNNYIFLDNNNFEQYTLNKNTIEEEKKQWLIEQERYEIILWNNNPINIIIPNFIQTKIINTEPSIKGESLAGNKIATIINGHKIKVPLFVQINQIIKIDTRTNSYVSKV